MFSLISLYFASRREVLLAERHVTGLTAERAIEQAPAAPVPAAQVEPAVFAPISLAA